MQTLCNVDLSLAITPSLLFLPPLLPLSMAFLYVIVHNHMQLQKLLPQDHHTVSIQRLFNHCRCWSAWMMSGKVFSGCHSRFRPFSGRYVSATQLVLILSMLHHGVLYQMCCVLSMMGVLRSVGRFMCDFSARLDSFLC